MDRISLITLALAKKFTKKSISALEQVVRYIGVTTTEITDGSTTNPITINGQSVTVVAGDTVFYNGTSYAWDGNAWQEVMNIAEIITVVEELGGKVHDILGDIAPEFNSESTYAVDDIVLYEDDLYIFTNAHTGAWDSSDVTVTSIAQLVDDLRAEIASTNGRVSALEVHVTQSGDVIDSDNHSLHIVGEAIEAEKTVSGNPITVTDALPYNAVSLSAEIKASQDLHGFDKPWVGGAGKNKYDLHSLIKTSPQTGISFTENSDGSMTINGGTTNGEFIPMNSYRFTGEELPLLPSTQYIFSIGSGKAQAGLRLEAYVKETSTSGWQAIVGTLNVDSITFTTPASIYDLWIRVEALSGVTLTTTTIYPMVRLASIADSSFEPYANICPISGRTEVVVDDVGKNKVETPSATAFAARGITLTTASNGETTLNGTSTAGSIDGDTFELPAGTYTISVGTTLPSGVWISLDGVSGAMISPTGKSISFTTTEAISTFTHIYVNAGVAFNNFKLNWMLEDGTTATAYEPYKSSSVTIQLGTTVYGGTLNVTTGVLTIKWVIKSVPTAGTFDGKNGSTVNDMYYFNISIFSDAKLPPTNADNVYIKSNAFSGDNSYEYVYQHDVAGIATNASGNFAIGFSKAMGIDTLEKARTWLTNNPLQICYELATPTTLQLTPAQLTMLKGYNRLSSDGGGDITLTYKANKADSVKAEVDVLETTKADNADVVDYIENGNTASRAYSANQFILWKGDLYKVITSIASGATITAGTNVSKTTIGAVLTALLNA